MKYELHRYVFSYINIHTFYTSAIQKVKTECSFSDARRRVVRVDQAVQTISCSQDVRIHTAVLLCACEAARARRFSVLKR